MKRMLRYPATNAICLGIFSLFYAIVFFHIGRWCTTVAIAVLALTAAVIALLLRRRTRFDEYHIAMLLSCLAVALVLTMIALAILYLIILFDAREAAQKFTVFIAIHWSTVVLSDLAFVLRCGGR